jgi:hypothetical protein
LRMFFCVLQFAILQFDEFPIPDCTITEHKVLFFCVLQLCNYKRDLRPAQLEEEAELAQGKHARPHRTAAARV